MHVLLFFVIIINIFHSHKSASFKEDYFKKKVPFCLIGVFSLFAHPFSFIYLFVPAEPRPPGPRSQSPSSPGAARFPPRLRLAPQRARLTDSPRPLISPLRPALGLQTAQSHRSASLSPPARPHGTEPSPRAPQQRQSQPVKKPEP